ncbi:MAG: hypothetical protein GY782_05875 [Gammaproteobacteria bacterium]|nr:hypothetical protein [Gammaproteobacteria bacterium]
MNKKSQQPSLGSQANDSVNSPLLVKEASPEAIQTAMATMKKQMLLAHPDIGSTLKESDLAVREQRIARMKSQQSAMLEMLAPRDAQETLLMQQMAIAQEWMSSCFCKASQYADHQFTNIVELGAKMTNLGIKFMSLYTKQLDALDRHRLASAAATPANPVQVNDGGQAIVGDVTINQGKHDES